MGEVPGARYGRTARQQHQHRQRRAGGRRAFPEGARFIHIDPGTGGVTVYEREQDMEGERHA